MSYEVALPDGRVVEFPDSVPREEAAKIIREQLLSKPTEGLLGAFGKGLESLVSSTRAGVKQFYSPEAAELEARAREEDISRRYADQIGFDKIEEAYKKRGLLSAAGEVAGQVPLALAQQAPNIAAAFTSARLGAMAGAPFGPVGGLVGGISGAFAPSLLQQLGGDIRRQGETARAEGRPVVIDRAAALAAAIPQAALDVVGTLIPLGRSLVGKALGPQVAKMLEKGAEESAEKLAKETLLKTVAKGTAIGALAEIPTEVTQQMLERAQAGLPLLSEDALREYGETAYETALISPIGAAGRVVDRSQARDIIEQRGTRQQREQRKAERIAAAQREEQEAAFKQTDEYALDFVTKHEALQKEYDDLGAQLKQKLPPGASFAQKQTMEDVKKRRAELKEQLQEQAAEYNQLLPKVAATREQQAQQQAAQEAAAQQQALAEQQARMREEQQAGPMQQLTIPGMEPQVLEEQAPTKPLPEEQRAKQLGLAQQRQEIEQLLIDNQQAQSEAVEKGDFDTRRRLAGQRTALQSELDYLKTQQRKEGVFTDEIAKAQKLQTQLDKARADLQNMSGPGYDPEAADKLDAKIQKLEEELSQYGGVQQALDLGKPEPLKGLAPQAARADYGARVYKPGAADIEAQEAAYLEEQRLSDEEMRAKYAADVAAYNQRAARARQESERLKAIADKAKAAPVRLLETELAALRNERRELRSIPERILSITPIREDIQQRDAAITARMQELEQRIATLTRKPSEERRAVQERREAEKPVSDLVESIRAQQPAPFVGRVFAGEGTAERAPANDLRSQLVFAKLTRNKPLIADIQRRLDELKEPEEVRAAEQETLTLQDVTAADRATEASRQQLSAFNKLVETLQYIKENYQGANDTQKARLRDLALQQKQVAIGYAIQEVNQRRLVEGQDMLDEKRQQRLVVALDKVYNELINRSSVAMLPKIKVPAKIRGAETLESARGPGRGERVFGNLTAASNVIREQAREIVDKVSGTAQRAAAKEKRITERKPQRVTPALRMQFAKSAAERSQAQLFKQAYDNATEAETAQLERIEKALPYIENNTVRESIMDSVRDKADGKPLELDQRAAAAVESLRRAATDEGAQAELFPGTSERGVTRATPGRFQRFLDSKEVAKLREEAAESQKRASYMAKMAAAIEARIEKERKAAEDYINKLTEGKAKTLVEAAQRALETAVDKNAEAARIADEINKRRSEERTRIAAMIAELDRARQIAQKKVDELAELGEFLTYEMSRYPRTSRVFQAAEKNDKQLKRAVSDYKAVIQAHANATALYNKILEAQASDTIDNALIREGAKAQKRIDEARQALSEARQAEADAKRAVEAVQKEQRTETEEQRRQRLLLYPSAGITRTQVIRDTSAASVDKVVKGQRGIIGKAEVAYQEARARGDEAGMATAAKTVETAYSTIHDALNNAPLLKLEVATAEDVQAHEAYETAQRNLAQAELEASFAEKGLPAPKMPPRRKLGPVTKSQSAAPTTMRTASPESRAGLTTKGQPIASRVAVQKPTVAAETKAAEAAPKSVLEEIAEKRAELRAINEQLAFINDNKNGPVVRGKATLSPRQEKAVKKAESSKKKILAELKKLGKQQQAVVAEAAVEKKGQRILRSEARGRLRAEVEEKGFAPEEEKPAMIRGVEVESPDLTPTQINSIEQNDVVAALEDIANDNTASELNRAVARRLSTLLDGTKIEIVDGLKDEQGRPVSGSATSKLIQLDRTYGLSQEVLLHEGVHAAVERVIQADESKLTKEQLIAKRELKALFAAIQNDSNITSKNAKSSLSEFVAEALSNSNLQRQLSQKKWKLSDAWKGIKSIILRLLGVKNPETMLGATLAAVDTLMIPSSQRMLAEAPAVEQRLAQKDIAALDNGSNSMKEFAAQFPQYIKQKDRTPGDVNRIGQEYLSAMAADPLAFIPEADPNKLDYKSDTIMSDGKEFDPNNPVHLVEATPTTFVALEALNNPNLQFREAVEITNKRSEALYGLVQLLKQNGAYTWPEQALVAKAASKYAVVATPEGGLKLAEIRENNRHPVAVVSKEAANAVIEELRKGKSLKAAFLDGLQRNADENAQRNKTKNGWQKFDQVTRVKPALQNLYTEEEIDDALDDTGYDPGVFQTETQLIEQLINDGVLPDRRPAESMAGVYKLEQAAVDLNAGCAGTSWCTGASVGTARGQIEDGDFYVYYKNGKPEVAIRMDGQDRIAEIRGNTPHQSLTPEQQTIAEDFLKTKTFAGAQEYVEEINRKNTLIRLFKGETHVGDSKVFGDVNVSPVAGMPKLADLEFKKQLTALFKFPTIDGYANKLRPAPSAKMLDTLTPLIKQSFETDRKAGYFFHDDIDFANDGYLYLDKQPNLNKFKKASKEETKLKFDPSKIKAARQIGISQDKVDLTSLKEVSVLWLMKATTVKAPALEFAGMISAIRNSNVEISDKAVVEALRSFGDDFPNLKITGGAHIAQVIGLNGIAKTTPYIKVETGVDSAIEKLEDQVTGIFNTATDAEQIDGDFKYKPVWKVAKNAGVEVNWRDGRFFIGEDIVPKRVFAATGRPAPAKKNAAPTDEQKKARKQLDVGLNVLNTFNALLPQKTQVYLAENPSYGTNLFNYPDDGPESLRFTEALTAQVKALKETLTEKELFKFFKELNAKKAIVAYFRPITLPEKPPVFETPAKIADAPPVEEATDTPEKPRYAPVNPALRDAVAVTDRVVSKNQSWWDGVRSNSIGTNKLAFETAAVDRFAPFEKLAKYQDRLKGTQMMYYLRMYDQRMNYAAQSAGSGALDLVEVERPDGQKEFLIESVEGPSLRNVVLILRDAKKLVGDVDATGRLFTLYLAAKRAERVGFSKLDLSGQVTEQELKDAVRQIEAVPELKEIFEDARDEYNAYNRNQVKFAEKAGVFSKEFADKLLRSNDYIPWYRERNGAVELWIGGETPFKLGNAKDSPHLEQLIGGDKPILDFMVSSVQNTNMLVDMSLRNIATRNAVFELTEMGGAIITPKPTTGPDVVKFKHKGEDRYAILTTERLKIGGKEIDTGIPAELVVKGMEGIPLQVTGLMRAIGFPTKVLRKFVTLNPSQMIRQVFRDSSQAFIAAGSNDVPVLGALREIRGAAQQTLTRRGITGGQVFTGTTEDIAKVMRDITKGGVNVNRLIAGLEAMAADIDAGTRASQYNSYLKQGMSQMEASLLSLESMNFNKRGASPSIHAANNLYAFFNAQVQGMNVLYKAMFGQLTPAERANVKQKIITRGAMLFAASLAYAHLMQDDEAYKNASPADKYGNWFIRIPGVKEPAKIPIPFELGYIFKALPEALYNAMMGKTDEVKEAAFAILRNVIPGASNMFIPTGLVPPVEIAANYSFFGQRPLLSAKEQSLLPEYQYRDNTTELAKLFGGATGTSPIKFEKLITGYTGGLGMVLLGAASLPFIPSDGPEKATKRLSDMPVIGDFFQPNDGGWVLNNTFDTLEDARKTQRSFNDLVEKGQKAEAKALLERRANDYARAELEGYYRHQMGELTKLETAIKSSDKSGEEKRELLDRVRQAKIKLATMVRDASDKTKLQASLS